jgi:hypothetical protein
VPYAVGRSGLVHDADCKVLGSVAWLAPNRVAALRVGHRLAKCCLARRVAPHADAGTLPKGWRLTPRSGRRTLSPTPPQAKSRVSRLD